MRSVCNRVMIVIITARAHGTVFETVSHSRLARGTMPSISFCIIALRCHSPSSICVLTCNSAVNGHIFTGHVLEVTEPPKLQWRRCSVRFENIRWKLRHAAAMSHTKKITIQKRAFRRPSKYLSPDNFCGENSVVLHSHRCTSITGNV